MILVILYHQRQRPKGRCRFFVYRRWQFHFYIAAVEKLSSEKLGQFEVLILTHNYPTPEFPNSGIWIRRLWGDKPVLLIGKLKGLVGAVRKLRQEKRLIIAYWMFPAGVVAYLSGRPYILNCVGLDVFLICRSKILSSFFKPILNRALKLVFIGSHPKKVFEEAYGDVYKSKSHLIYLPVDSGEFN